MPSSESYLAELESKSQGSIDRLAVAWRQMVQAEGLSVIDVLKLEFKSVIEQTEAAALWMGDTDDLAFKMSLAEACGSGARRYDLLRGRLSALGVDPHTFDPRVLGYSKLFAYFRSLQTTEERACASSLTLQRFALLRYAAIASLAAELGDEETATVFRETFPAEERRLIDAGRKALVLAADDEESQARARRSSFRVIELVAEINEPSLIKKFLARSTKKTQ